MAKFPPAFQYYPADFNEGAKLFTLEEVGAYQLALNHQWMHGGVPGDSPGNLAKIWSVSRTVSARLWKVISVKFVRGEDGLWRNYRLEKVRRDLLEIKEENRRGGRARAATAKREHGRFVTSTPGGELDQRAPAVNQLFDLRSSSTSCTVRAGCTDLERTPAEPASLPVDAVENSDGRPQEHRRYAPVPLPTITFAQLCVVVREQLGTSTDVDLKEDLRARVRELGFAGISGEQAWKAIEAVQHVDRLRTFVNAPHVAMPRRRRMARAR